MLLGNTSHTVVKLVYLPHLKRKLRLLAGMWVVNIRLFLFFSALCALHLQMAVKLYSNILNVATLNHIGC